QAVPPSALPNGKAGTRPLSPARGRHRVPAFFCSCKAKPPGCGGTFPRSRAVIVSSASVGRRSIALTAGHPVLAQVAGFLHAAADAGEELPALRTIRILHPFLAVFVCRKGNTAFLAGQQICNFHKIAPLYIVMPPAVFWPATVPI